MRRSLSEAGAAAAGHASLSWGGHFLVLLPGKAVWVPEREMLLVADVHIGKAQSFRRLGVPVPHGTTEHTLERLTAMLRQHAARSLVFLGDFLHSAHAHAAATQATVHRWRDGHADVAMTLVRGNHDDRAGDPPTSLGFTVVDEPWLLPCPSGAASPGLALCHHPRALAGHQVLAGHEHPCVRLGGRARDRLRLPCFHFRGEVGVLPAFGSFTGMHAIWPRPNDRVWVVADERVATVPVDATTAS